jgi:formate dehydrogenase gamma subunit
VPGTAPGEISGLIIPGAIVLEAADVVADHPAPSPMKKAVERILRFHRSERLLHWAIAVPFLVCAGSAFVLVAIFNPDPTMPHREVVSWIHRISGALLVGLPPLVLLTHLRDYKIHINNIKEGTGWSFDDIKWIALFPMSVLSKKVKLPEEGKFNGAEMMNFCMVLSMYPIMGSTGIIIWTMGSALLPWLIHFSLAAAMMPLIGGHIFMATTFPATRVGLSGMFTGMVDRSWASHHYRRWFKENFDPLPGDDHHAPLGAPEMRGSFRTEVIPKSAFIAAHRARGIVRYATFGATLVVAVLAMIVIRPFAARAMVSNLHVRVESTSAVITAETLLLSRPVSDASVLPGKLDKGAKVVRFGDFGPYALVQDAQGRAGYVLATALGVEAPAKPVEPEKPVVTTPDGPATTTTPGSDNADCKQASSEPDSTACVMRAEATLTDCIDACAAEASEGCAEACQTRHDTCLESCAGASSDPNKGPAKPLGWTDPKDTATPGVKKGPKPAVRPNKPVGKKRNR